MWYQINVISLKNIDKIFSGLKIFWEQKHFFSIWFFFHEHSRFTVQQGKRGIYLTSPYHFHPLHRCLDISRELTAESSPLRIASSRTRTGDLWFPNGRSLTAKLRALSVNDVELQVTKSILSSYCDFEHALLAGLI